MKTSNVEPFGNHAADSATGRRSTNLAGSKGMVWRDGATESVGQIRDMTAGPGLTFIDNEDGTGNLLLGSGSGGSVTPNWINVMDYGATGDGVTLDCDAINDAIDALNANGGGVLYLPKGVYLCDTGLNAITEPCMVLGDGRYTGASGPISVIEFTSTTGTLFTVTAHGCKFSQFAMRQTGGTATAGAAIVTTGGTLAAFESVTILSFYIGIDIEGSSQWTMQDCYINGALYGVKIRNTAVPDTGDWSIANSTFVPGGGTAIRVESSGGGKITNVKINGNRTGAGHGIDVSMATGVGTSVLMISNCSIENVLGDGIKIATAGTGVYALIDISNVQFGMYDNSAGSCIRLTANTLGEINDVILSNLLLRALPANANPAIVITKTVRVVIGHVINDGFASVFSESGSTVTTDDTGAIAAGVKITGTPSAGQVPVASGATAAAWASLSGGGIAPSGADYLVATAQAGLSAEIVVGATPGGELGNTWASPTVDATHSGSTHTDFIAKAIVDAKGDLIAATAADTVARVPVGTDGKFLKADSGAAAGVSWDTVSGSGAVATDAIWDAKGDLAAATGANAATKVTVGADGTFLKADSGASNGVSWDTPAGTGSVATDGIWDAKGDLAGGTGANTAAKLTVGANGTVLTADSAQSTGLAWTAPGTYSAWTPTLTADGGDPNLGSTGSAVGRYTQIGKMVHAYGVITFAGTGVSAGSGTYEVAYPVAPATSSAAVWGTAVLFDSSAGFRAVAAIYFLDSGEFRLTFGSGTASGLVTNAIPWTWAASDIIFLDLMYEAA